MREVKILENTKKMTETAYTDAKNGGHKVVLVSLGTMGMAQDTLQDLYKRTSSWYEKSYERGTEIEKRFRHDADELLTESRKRFETAENDLEAQVKKVVDRLKVPTQDEIKGLTKNLEDVEGRIEGFVRNVLKMEPKKVTDVVAEVETKVEATVEAIVQLPFADYAELTAKEINQRMSDMTLSEMRKVLDYEGAHENRVTVIREINRRLEAMPIGNYDELTVDDITHKLDDFDEAQLTVIAQYERAHSGRVGVLEYIEKRLRKLELMGA
jgi:polyhydroxyalkanoate synthesis regulator phasin